ncbi:MAG: hypothetical protein IK024_10825 [Treponema sp.]|nr:hypothetical protein [Treponema sp.]
MNNNEPIQLLRSETKLPANILDVQYYKTFEFGLLEYIVVQNDMFDDINYENTFWILFTEKAEDIFYDHSDSRKLSHLHSEFLYIMKEYVKKSYADKDSVLSKLFEQCKQEWAREHSEEEITE